MTTTAMTAQILHPIPRFAGAPGGGAIAPPSAMRGSSGCPYLNAVRGARLGTKDEQAARSAGGADCGGSADDAFEALLEHVEARVKHVPRDIQRGDVSHRRVATRQQDQAVLVRVLLDCVAAVRVRLLGRLSLTNSVACIIPSP